MPCHKVDYEILGSEMQIVEVELDPGETVVAEAGAMNYMEDGIEFAAKMGDGSDPEQGFFGKLASAGKRMLTGESIFLTHFSGADPEDPDTPRRTTRTTAPLSRPWPADRLGRVRAAP